MKSSQLNFAEEVLMRVSNLELAQRLANVGSANYGFVLCEAIYRLSALTGNPASVNEKGKQMPSPYYIKNVTETGLHDETLKSTKIGLRVTVESFYLDHPETIPTLLPLADALKAGIAADTPLE